MTPLTSIPSDFALCSSTSLKWQMRKRLTMPPKALTRQISEDQKAKTHRHIYR